MTPGMEWLLIAWGIVTGILLILVFYRSTLTRQEDDQLFIDESSSSRATEQSQLIAKVNKINPLVKLVGATSGLMILAIAGWAVYLGLNSVHPSNPPPQEVERLSNRESWNGRPLLGRSGPGLQLSPNLCDSFFEHAFALKP